MSLPGGGAPAMTEPEAAAGQAWPREIHCPGCSRAYLLPPGLAGPSGARVRCPVCGAQWRIAADPAGGAPPSEAARGSAGRPRDLASEAARLVEEWAAPRRMELRRAEANQALWRRFGAEIAELFARFRQAAGAGEESAAAFRWALRARAGIELPEGASR